MDTMDCTEARDLLSEHQDRTLDAGTDAAVAAHLGGCGECAGADASLLAVRELLRSLPPDPAPPDLLPRVLASVEAEDRIARPGSTSGGAAARPALSRLRVPLEAAAVLLLFASVYWYRQIPTPAVPSPPALSSGISSEAGKSPSSRPPAAKADTGKGSPPGSRIAHAERRTAREAPPSAPKPRTWTAESLPSVPASLASTDAERIVPYAPPRPLSAFSYGRDIVVDVKPESREGAEERIAETTSRLGGIVEGIERERGATGNGAGGTVRLILPEAASAGFLDELRRIGTVPPEGGAGGIDFPPGPRPGTVAYTVRIRVR
jgi:Putative zinc-finger